MDITLLVGTVLDLTGFDFSNGLGEIHGDSAKLRVRHQAARTENLTEAADNAHHVGSSYSHIKIKPTTLNFGYELFSAYIISTCSLCLGDLVTLCKNKNSLGLAGTIGQYNCATDLLISILRIDAETNMELDGLIELSRRSLLYELHRFSRCISLAFFDELCGVLVLLTVFCHLFVFLLSWSNGISLPRHSTPS